MICELYEELNMAGFYGSGSCERNEDGTYSMEEYAPDYEECCYNEYENYTFTPSEMVDYAISREEEDGGDYSWCHDISNEPDAELREILNINFEEDLDYYPRSLMYNLIVYADSLDDKELLNYAKTVTCSEPKPVEAEEVFFSACCSVEGTCWSV